MGIIDAETRQRAIDAQGQTDQRRFVQNYVQANRGGGKTDAQLRVEASQIYLRANNIYAGQTNRMADYMNLVEGILAMPMNPLTKAYNQAFQSGGTESQVTIDAFQAILDSVGTVQQYGKELLGQ